MVTLIRTVLLFLSGRLAMPSRIDKNNELMCKLKMDIELLEKVGELNGFSDMLA